MRDERRADLTQLVSSRQSAILLFGMTPPRRTTAQEDVQRVADLTIERLAPLDLDGLVLYDIDDESDRNAEARPFPYLETMDPAEFYARYLGGWDRPVVIYRCVGKYREASIEPWLRQQDPGRVMCVFVGASSRDKPVLTTLPRPRRRGGIRARTCCSVASRSRNGTRSRGEEHLRLLAKQDGGCTYFVTQVVYDINAAKNLVSDYHYTCRERGVEAVPVIFTLSVCGSVKTLEFLTWLGIDVPRWKENQLRNAQDTLDTSYDLCLRTARELREFCEQLGVPYGFNVESVSVRKAEIEASVALAGAIAGLGS